MSEPEAIVLEQGEMPKNWIPYSPGGVALTHLAGESEATAWRNLIHRAESDGKYYATRTGLSDRGYTVKNQLQ